VPPDEFEFEWDERKNRANLRKHGLDFEDAASVFDGPTYFQPDVREHYGEERWQATGNLNGVVVVMVFVERAVDRFRIVSFRKANAKERKEYETHVENRLGPGSADDRF
jgi:uncharacterized DUF497 family protein